jgi:hypothetical protein
MNKLKILLENINYQKASGNISEACRIAEKFLLTNDNYDVWRTYAWLLIQSNQSVNAISVYRNLIKFPRRLSDWEIAEARTIFSKFVLDEKHKIVYMHIPKCGSSTIKDLIYYIHTGNLSKEFSHSLIENFYIVINRNHLLNDEYKNWDRILVVRDPIKRLRSYYAKNIMTENSLVKECNGLTEYMGLKTRPSYSEILLRFFEYRAMFKDFRHHTNSVTSYAGNNPDIYTKIMGINEINNFIRKCSEKYNIHIPSIENMKNSNEINISNSDKMEEEMIANFYNLDYKIYGQYF